MTSGNRNNELANLERTTCRHFNYATVYSPLPHCPSSSTERDPTTLCNSSLQFTLSPCFACLFIVRFVVVVALCRLRTHIHTHTTSSCKLRYSFHGKLHFWVAELQLHPGSRRWYSSRETRGASFVCLFLSCCLFICLFACCFSCCCSVVVTAVLKLIGSTQLLAAQRFATLMNDTWAEHETEA